MLPLEPNRSLRLARRRARLRRKSGGAVIFIVAMTLALLAVMGIYGLTATALDVQGAGHMRQATQAQHAAEFSAMATAETFTPGTTSALIRVLTDPNRTTNSTAGSLVGGKCRSVTQTPTNLVENRNGEVCLLLTEEQMMNVAKTINVLATFAPATNSYCATPANCPFFVKRDITKAGAPDGSFGEVPQRPFMRVEITNPLDIPPPPGSGLDGKFTFTQLTATVYVDMKATLNQPADTVMVARGRLTVGPYSR